ncbi:MAG: type II-A CRISPR-associated protein Csn2 [Lachnospiraceae bacterium]|nr:type II-A CRISPR-associated protein Csn2 [Lachnospiraceae bacterium]
MELERPINFSSEQCALWVIESPKKFAEYVQELCVQQAGGEGRFVLSENDKEVNFEKYVEIVINPFSVDINDKRILGKLYKELQQKALGETMYLHTQKIISALNQYFMELEQQETYFLTVDEEIDMTAIFKAMGVKVESYADNYIQNISQYMKLIAELLDKKVMIFVNLRSYMEIEQIEEIMKEAVYNGIEVLFIESNQKNFPKGITQYIIDNDICEI